MMMLQRSLFFNYAQAFNAHPQSYVQTAVAIDAQATFRFPTGDLDHYFPFKILEADAASARVQFHYSLPPASPSGEGVAALCPNFYWETAGTKRGKIQLAWTAQAQLDQWNDAIEELLLLGYDGREWVNLPATLIHTDLQSNLEQGALRSNASIDFSAYQAFTLGNRSLNHSLEISQAITPNGDGQNERWFIQNIERYPQAKIWVYNRWGKEVFYSAGNYQNDWRGTYKNNTTHLPEAAYFYRLDTDDDGAIDREGWLYITY